MKKIILPFLVAAVAMTASATMVSWSTGVVTGPDSSKPLENVNVYCIFLEKSAAEVASENSLGSLWLYREYYAATEDALIGSTGSDGIAYRADDSLDTKDKPYALWVFEYDDGNGNTIGLARILEAPPAGTQGGGAASTQDIFGKAVAGGSRWASVPEPCTVALLALGMAAIGLKRRVA